MVPGYLNQKGAAVKKQLPFCRKKCHINKKIRRVCYSTKKARKHLFYAMLPGF